MTIIGSTDYLKQVREFIRYGGMHARAANEAAETEMNLRAELDIHSMTIDHGESRLKNCIKCDLAHGLARCSPPKSRPRCGRRLLVPTEPQSGEVWFADLGMGEKS